MVVAKRRSSVTQREWDVVNPTWNGRTTSESVVVSNILLVRSFDNHSVYVALILVQFDEQTSGHSSVPIARPNMSYYCRIGVSNDLHYA